jgi:hypothetical protein
VLLPALVSNRSEGRVAGQRATRRRGHLRTLLAAALPWAAHVPSAPPRSSFVPRTTASINARTSPSAPSRKWGRPPLLRPGPQSPPRPPCARLGNRGLVSRGRARISPETMQERRSASRSSRGWTTMPEKMQETAAADGCRHGE